MTVRKIIIIIATIILITLLNICLLGNHLSQIVHGASFGQGKEIHPIP